MSKFEHFLGITHEEKDPNDKQNGAHDCSVVNHYTITCISCSQPAEPDHPCPYAEDIDGDSETLCNCCDSCQSECAADI